MILANSTHPKKAMEILNSVLALALISILILTVYIYNRAEKINAPEPPGSWPFIGHLRLLSVKIPAARILGAMADDHGPIFSLRIGTRRAVVVSSWEAVKQCFSGSNDRNFASRPSLAVGKFMGQNHALFSLAPYGDYWRDVRKMVTLELLTSRRLEMMKDVRADEYKVWMRDLYLSCTKPRTNVVLSGWIELLTFNLIIRMLAGKRFSTVGGGGNDGEDGRLKEAIKKALYLSGVFVYSDVIPFIQWLDIGGHMKTMKQAGKDLDEVLGEWLEEHSQNGSTKSGADFMDVMLSTIPENAVISGHTRNDIIKSTTAVLILTGSESTSETIIWALSLLLNNPETLKLAQEELDTNIGKNRWVEESDIKTLNYLQSIVKETFRLYPPGPLSGPREAIEDCYIGDVFVPKRTRLIVNLWKLHRDPRIWSEDAPEFKPERFLDEHADVSLKGQNFEFIPFSSGRRMCPAVNYGLQVVQLTLARILQGFEMTTPAGIPVDMEEGLGIALPKVKPLEVVLCPRLSDELYLKNSEVGIIKVNFSGEKQVLKMPN